ncbi:unnamed protein product [Blepharisma stoltei]|uniref:Uncharacterized protein n=1 Tax=Blepharisma stoltei TaxID=1481888 RepID=A0AAU9IL56_9CILI|nr:unnamed protein product [Blepharisma stoltei]
MIVDTEEVNTLFPENSKPNQTKKSSIKELYTYATPFDYFLIAVGSISAIAMGSIQPLFFIFMGNFFGDMGPDTSANEFYDNAKIVCYQFIGCAFVFGVTGYLSVMCFINVGARQAFNFRKKYFESIMSCDPSWFDLKQVAELPQSLATETLMVERATGDKLVILIFTIGMILSSFIISIIEGTQLTLFCLLFCPTIVGGFFLANKGLEQNAKFADTSYKKAGGIAEEALEEIKTVSSLNGQKHEASKYINAVKESKKSMYGGGLKAGLGIAMAMSSFIVMNGITFIIGAWFIDKNEDCWVLQEPYDLTKTIIVMWVSLMTFNNISLCVPCLKIINQGRIAAHSILAIINTKSQLVQGTRTTEISGKIVFDNVKFSYPSTPHSEILKGMSFELEPGQRLGVVGSTGSGKSTIIQLLLRYYEPTSGSIFIDGHDIREYSISYLRENIGIVSQEPLLFNTSIYENIRYGKLDAKEAEIHSAAGKAGAHDFIRKLPLGYETPAGAKGSQLSGGQKQRIAIARAIIRNPKILLLDEATSALDRQTEQAVVDDIDKAMPESTRITIAQNLLTIKDSTFIIMIDQGTVLEYGNHKQLMKNKSKYYHLIKMQKIQQRNADEEQVKGKLTDLDASKSISEGEKVVQEEDVNVRKKMLSFSKSERFWLYFGIFGSLVVAASYPISGMLNGKQIFVLSNEDNDMLSKSAEYGGWICFLAFFVAIGLIMESISYPRMSANITTKMREASFKALLKFEAAFFDIPENNCSALSARLCNDCEKVNGLSGSMIGILISIAASLAVAHGTAAAFSWRMSLVFLAVIPVIFTATAASFLAQSVGVVKFDYESCTSTAADAIMNYRTAKAFNLENIMLERYLEPAKAEFAGIKKKAQLSGFTYGLGFGAIFCVYSLLFWYGAKLVVDGLDSYENMVIAMVTCQFGSDSFMIAGVYMPDVKNGIEAAKRLFKILEYKPTINVNSKDGDKKEIEGKVEFKDVSFSYPNRNYMALKSLSFSIEPGTHFAIIGRTGSGKSTVIQLLLRLYDPAGGKVLIDNMDIKKYNLKHLRRQIGYVGQEPVLFSGSIAENISYGVKSDQEEIEEAARKAQALEFITDSKYPETFDRQVGIKGSMLSGGQKQRIAIARAIIRNPKILIFDEATSALDPKTEAVLLSTIKEVMAEKTCIMIAHRLKTISEAHQVMVLESGKILEIGTREDLMSQKGYFYNMISNL